MITIQSNIKISSVTIFFDNEGIEEMIGFLTHIKNRDVSFHLSIGNELEETPFDEDMFVVPHAKIINIDKLDDR
jgi:hypothetical protein